MSVTIMLADADGNAITLDDDLDAEMRGLVPRRAAVGFDSDSVNITYNLSPMLWAAGMPEWNDLPLTAAAAGAIWYRVACELRIDPQRFAPYNPKNGWGTYNDAVAVTTYLALACLRYPDAKVWVLG